MVLIIKYNTQLVLIQILFYSTKILIPNNYYLQYQIGKHNIHIRLVRNFATMRRRPDK